jgi:hypothetical protein
MTKQEFEGLVKSGVSISERRKLGEGFELYGYRYRDDDAASSAIEEIENSVTAENGDRLMWSEIQPLLDYIISIGWPHIIEIDVENV